MAYMGSERHAWCASFKVSSGIWVIAKIEQLVLVLAMPTVLQCLVQNKQALILVTILYCPS